MPSATQVRELATKVELYGGYQRETVQTLRTYAALLEMTVTGDDVHAASQAYTAQVKGFPMGIGMRAALEQFLQRIKHP